MPSVVEPMTPPDYARQGAGDARGTPRILKRSRLAVTRYNHGTTKLQAR
ncbi:hypothetical protein [Singulisphaera acidiphila]|uniref:Uncharacterized protein n=1 Tax=Singulisphaera acidiphila (strain ATCC BAA-1392 / DSM 18658 / VKM B-2454 / MOB10) TaxID=886293 RepID=L0D915_SINAD|nr:hypothetical protein [Singulisphaera acidiphila]AGA25737.1 hypothetical protein Sinac_1352 [Singulisphaera acidiphila DSM 18658]